MHLEDCEVGSVQQMLATLENEFLYRYLKNWIISLKCM